jgi:Tol biopolymer transport system component
MNADGSGVERLTDLPWDEESPAWSPDGTRIAFIRVARDELLRDIYVMNADGTDVTRLFRDPDFSGVEVQRLDWSPDGAKIAFVRNLPVGKFDIYVMNADGTGLERLTDAPLYDFSPAWSPDGTKIAFESRRDGGFDIYVMNTDGTSVSQLTDDPAADGRPSWSPDGTAFVFESLRDGKYDIYMMNADGTGVRRLTDLSGTVYDYDLVWSPTD